MVALFFLVPISRARMTTDATSAAPRIYTLYTLNTLDTHGAFPGS